MSFTANLRKILHFCLLKLMDLTVAIICLSIYCWLLINAIIKCAGKVAHSKMLVIQVKQRERRLFFVVVWQCWKKSNCYTNNNKKVFCFLLLRRNYPHLPIRCCHTRNRQRTTISILNQIAKNTALNYVTVIMKACTIIPALSFAL